MRGRSVANPYDSRHQRARLEQLETDPWCWVCGEPATVADHDPPLSRHDHDPAGCWCVYRSMCDRCSRAQGGNLGAATTNARIEAPSVDVWEDPDPVPSDDPRWEVDWLADLRANMPESASWPRFATLPHPSAVGSYGAEVEERALADHGIDLRWWQRLTARLLLQHDADGQLCFRWAIISAARQSGKTWLIRELAWWRMHAAETFADVQQVVHSARTLTPAWDAILPILYDLLESDTYAVNRAQARFGVWLGESGWRVIAQSNVYGQTASLGILDEGWGIKPTDVTDGFEPTIVERPSGQLLFISTAHRRATALIPQRRIEALAEIEEPGGGLILEWSTPRTAELADRDAWRQASPHWSTRREEMMAEALNRAESGISIDPTEPDPVESFRAQWLNQWNNRVVAPRRGEPLVDPERWDSLAVTAPTTPSGTAALAIEDYHGAGYGVVLVGEIDGERLLARCWQFDRRTDLLGWLRSVVALPTLIAGVTLAADPEIQRISPVIVRHGSTETAMALPMFRELVASRRLHHVDSPALSGQVYDAMVKRLAGGLTLVGTSRTDLVRCCAWAARYVELGFADPGGIS